MTKEEFDNTKFSVGMKIIILKTGEIHNLIAVDFDCLTLGIDRNNEVEPLWFSIDECNIVTQD